MKIIKITYLDENFNLLEKEIKTDKDSNLIGHSSYNELAEESYFSYKDGWGFLFDIEDARYKGYKGRMIKRKIFITEDELIRKNDIKRVLRINDIRYPSLSYDKVVTIEYGDKIENKIDKDFSKRSNIKNCLLMQKNLDDSKIALQLDGSVKYYQDRCGLGFVFVCTDLESAKNLKFYDVCFLNYYNVKICYGNLKGRNFYPSNKKEANHIVVFTTDNEGKSNNKNIELLIRKLEKYNIMYKYIEVKSSDEISSVFIVIDKKENDDLYEHLQQIDK